MYLHSKLNEEISKLKKAQKGKWIVNSVYLDNHKYYIKAMEKDVIKFTDEKNLGTNFGLIELAIRWFNKRIKKEVFDIQVESTNYPILHVINLCVSSDLFTQAFTQENLAKKLEDVDYKKIITAFLSRKISAIISDSYYSENPTVNPCELKNFAENIIALALEEITEKEIYTIFCQDNATILPNINEALEIRAQMVKAKYLGEPIVLINTEKNIIKIYQDDISVYVIGKDDFEFNGEVYPASKESLQIIDWVNFGAGYFSESF